MHEEKLRLSRDSFEPIRPILDLDQPFDVLDDMLESAWHDLPDRRLVTGYDRAIAVRRFVLVLLVIETALRRRNVSTLTWHADNKGQLRMVDDDFEIVLPVDEFKNRDSSLFVHQNKLGRGRSAYTNRLITKYGDAIREYVETSRPFLRGNNQTEYLFVNRYGNPLSEDQLYDDFAAYTWKYLVYHEHLGTGIKGVERFGPHAVRHILVTDILKQTGDAQLAADAIQDTVETVSSTYAAFFTEDRIKRVNQHRAWRRDVRNGINSAGSAI